MPEHGIVTPDISVDTKGGGKKDDISLGTVDKLTVGVRIGMW